MASQKEMNKLHKALNDSYEAFLRKDVVTQFDIQRTRDTVSKIRELGGGVAKHMKSMFVEYDIPLSGRPGRKPVMKD